MGQALANRCLFEAKGIGHRFAFHREPNARAGPPPSVVIEGSRPVSPRPRQRACCEVEGRGGGGGHAVGLRER